MSLPKERWQETLSSKSVVLSTMDWIFRNMIVDDEPPEPVPKPHELRYFQACLSNSCAVILDEKKVGEQVKLVAILPCSSGKTYAVFRVAVDVYEGNLLVMYVVSVFEVERELSESS
mgnify:FL=1